MKWAQKYDKELLEILSNKEYSLKVLGIERGNAKPRKDIAKWSDVKDNIIYMYDEKFQNNKEYPYQVINEKAEINKIIDLYIEKYYDEKDDKQTWFDKIKQLSGEMGYAKEVKEFKANPDMYKAHVGDVSTVLRVALTGRTNTPDMYEIMQVLGKESVVNRIKNAINNFLKEHGETLSDDIFGITFIKVNAREDEIKSIGNVTIFPCFGLSHLMNICFKKGEKSYRFAIKNSLIQIGKKAIQEYLDTISNKILNNYVYFDYLCLQFEPNFINYIAFCFEKITDIYEQKGIKDEECNNLSDYLEHYQINRDQNLKNLNIIHCMVCNKIPKNPYKCKLCESEICENCYLKEENFACKNCENEEFDRVDNKCDDEKKEDEETENKINFNINQENSSENYLNKNEIKEEKDLSKENCMICDKQIQTPLKCNNCEYKVCENCYLTKLQDDGYYSCDNCGKEEFELDENEGIKDEIKKNDENKIEDGEENENKLNLNPNYINDSADFDNYLRNLQETEGKKLSKELCMICNQPPSEPLKCMKCGYRICYMCYLKKLDSQGTYVCENVILVNLKRLQMIKKNQLRKIIKSLNVIIRKF